MGKSTKLPAKTTLSEKVI